jgi:hypothetical protein
MTEWMYRTSWILANDASRPKLLPNVKLAIVQKLIQKKAYLIQLNRFLYYK